MTRMRDPLSGLNAQQRQVVETTEGPVLVLAGAGSGKTRALTHRIAYLMEAKGVAPEQILAVTFTNKAAREMRERMQRLVLPEAAGRVLLVTFHSLGARLLRELALHHSRTARFSILDTHDSERLIKQALERSGYSAKQWPPRRIRHRISQAKNEGVGPAALAGAAQRADDEVVAAVYAVYEQLLAEHDAFDFDDLILEPLKLLTAEAGVRERLHRRWRYVSVDEYQDTNPTQDALLAQLLGPHQNLCVVGDDYQAIYSWRGARVDHILEFERRFTSCQTIYLTQNYRSTSAILTAANAVIAQNQSQKHKELWTEAGAGSAVQVVECVSDRAEAAWVTQAVAEHLAQGGRAAAWAVLYRTNAQSRLFEEAFVRSGIPYVIVGGVRFYDRAEVKDVMALLQLYLNPNAYLPLERLSKILARGVGPRALAKLSQAATASGVPLRAVLTRGDVLSAQQTKALAPLARALSTTLVRQWPRVDQLLEALITTSNYGRYLGTLPDGDDRRDNVAELMNVAARYTDPLQFAEEVALMTEADAAAAGADAVTCMTLHAAKGLEFPRVVVAGCEEQLLPHRNSVVNSAGLEEERRLLYVGMTRAQQQLVLSYARQRAFYGELAPAQASRFLEALPSDVEYVTADGSSSGSPAWQLGQEPHDPNEPVYTAYEIGDAISHPRFGRGVVIQMDGSVVTCVFEGHGVKTLDGGTVEAPL